MVEMKYGYVNCYNSNLMQCVYIGSHVFCQNAVIYMKSHICTTTEPMSINLF